MALFIVIYLVGLQPTPAPAMPSWGRIVTTPTLHVGIRPHFHADGQETAAAITLQVTR